MSFIPNDVKFGIFLEFKLRNFNQIVINYSFSSILQSSDKKAQNGFSESNIKEESKEDLEEVKEEMDDEEEEEEDENGIKKPQNASRKRGRYDIPQYSLIPLFNSYWTNLI